MLVPPCPSEKDLCLAWVCICPEVRLMVMWDPWWCHGFPSLPLAQGLIISPQIKLLAKHIWLEFIQSPNKPDTPSGQKSNSFLWQQLLRNSGKQYVLCSQSFYNHIQSCIRCISCHNEGFEKSEASKMDREIKPVWTFEKHLSTVGSKTLMSAPSLCKRAQ